MKISLQSMHIKLFLLLALSEWKELYKIVNKAISLLTDICSAMEWFQNHLTQQRLTWNFAGLNKSQKDVKQHGQVPFMGCRPMRVLKTLNMLVITSMEETNKPVTIQPMFDVFKRMLYNAWLLDINCSYLTIKAIV